MSANKLLGLDAKLFIGTAGTKGSTSTDDFIKNVSLNLGSEVADVSTRSDTIKAEMIARLTASIEADYIYDSASTAMTTVRAAYLAKTKISVFVSTNGTEGMDFDCQVSDFPIDQNLIEGQGGKIKFIVCVSRGWVTGSGS